MSNIINWLNGGISKYSDITNKEYIQNIFNRDNEWEKVYLEDGTYTMSYQYKQTPIMGLIIEF